MAFGEGENSCRVLIERAVGCLKGLASERGRKVDVPEADPQNSR
ncbi:MAG: hypothetical protein ACUVTM_02815 [Candidatus Bathyarchaeia archaeon]